jgi:hypothetical protein
MLLDNNNRLRFARKSDPKKWETQSSLTGFNFGWLKLKGCSAGGWRSGRRRSEEVGGGGTFRLYFGLPCLPRFLRAPSVPRKGFSGNRRTLIVEGWVCGLVLRKFDAWIPRRVAAGANLARSLKAASARIEPIPDTRPLKTRLTQSSLYDAIAAEGQSTMA